MAHNFGCTIREVSPARQVWTLVASNMRNSHSSNVPLPCSGPHPVCVVHVHLQMSLSDPACTELWCASASFHSSFSQLCCHEVGPKQSCASSLEDLHLKFPTHLFFAFLFVEEFCRRLHEHKLRLVSVEERIRYAHSERYQSSLQRGVVDQPILSPSVRLIP